MNILVVSYKAEISGGSNRSLLSILNILVQRKHNVTLILPKSKGSMYKEALNLNIKCIYIPLSRVGVSKSKNKLKNALNMLIMYLKLAHDLFEMLKNRREIRAINPDLVYTNGATMHGGKYLSMILNIPHIWHIREFFDENQIWPLNIYKIMDRYTTQFILISRSLYDDYAKYIKPEKLSMIHNGIKLTNKPEKIKHNGFNILITGRITSQKNHKIAIMALNELLKEYNEIHLYIAGDAVNNSDKIYKNKLIELINDFHISEHVTFLGNVEEMSTLRRIMDIELMCSFREPFGRVTVEAMRSGLPVVGANSGGTRDIVIDGYNGYLFNSNKWDDLAQKIEILFLDRELLDNMSRRAREYSESHFTEKQLYETVYLLENIVK